MCVLHFNSKNNSFKNIVQRINIKPYEVIEKGDSRGIKKKIYDNYLISFDVSKKSWDDPKDQIKDTIEFLNNNKDDIIKIINDIEDLDGYLDFPFNSRLANEVFMQCDHLPKELVIIAGELKLGIEISYYNK